MIVGCVSVLSLLVAHGVASPVTLQSLLKEMVDRTAVARFPNPPYQSLQASSYNRESTSRDKPGWFADSDGTGYIRTEQKDGKTEWVMMEHQGSGCITKIWTPFFYYDFNERVGPNVRIYLDGSDQPVIDESLINLVTGKGTFKPPYAQFTARAGDSYLPIPFAKSCKVTMTAKPFYNIINYRAYPEGTRVESFSLEKLRTVMDGPSKLAKELTTLPKPPNVRTHSVPAGKDILLSKLKGPGALSSLVFRVGDFKLRPSLLRTTILSIECDGEETVWCPLGDFFSCPDSLHPYHTFQRSVDEDGTMTSNWVMPYEKSCEVRLFNFGPEEISAEVGVGTTRFEWDDRSMHFRACWRPDNVVAGSPFQDWNFVDIKGKGVYVGDSWMVVNPQKDNWWGEGDEKIYVDDAWDKGFPTHFGTGSEDYYGWAGGVLPTREDEFSMPFLANVRVGGVDGHTQGYNICTRTRSLDAIPFNKRLRFDMESSFGVDARNTWNLLGYSAVTFFYALPGATHNRRVLVQYAVRPIIRWEDLKKLSDMIRTPRG